MRAKYSQRQVMIDSFSIDAQPGTKRVISNPEINISGSNEFIYFFTHRHCTCRESMKIIVGEGMICMQYAPFMIGIGIPSYLIGRNTSSNLVGGTKKSPEIPAIFCISKISPPSATSLADRFAPALEAWGYKPNPLSPHQP